MLGGWCLLCSASLRIRLPSIPQPQNSLACANPHSQDQRLLIGLRLVVHSEHGSETIFFPPQPVPPPFEGGAIILPTLQKASILTPALQSLTRLFRLFMLIMMSVSSLPPHQPCPGSGRHPSTPLFPSPGHSPSLQSALRVASGGSF